MTTTTAARDAFNASLRAALDAALAAAGIHDEHVRIADRTLRLRFAGRALVDPVMRALRHLGVPAALAPDLTIGLWDTESTGVDLPACPWPLPEFFVRCDAVQHGWGERVHAAFSIKSGLLQYLDEDAACAVAWVRDPGRLQAWTRTAPLRALLAGWAESIGACGAHAAAVGSGGRGLLLPAPSGGGKSTTALASLARGLDLAGDDFVLLRGDGAGPSANAVYASAKVAPDQLGAGSSLGLDGRTGGGEPAFSEGKRVLWLDETHPRQLASRLALRAIVVPRVSAGGETSLRRASATEALRALVPPTVFMLPGVGPRSYQRLVAVSTALPAFVLELGRDHARNVAALRGLLEADGPLTVEKAAPGPSSSR